MKNISEKGDILRILDEELEKIIEFAKNDKNIRALVLQGSYVNKSALIDEFSDLDPLFYVDDLDKFINDDAWKKQFGYPISCFNDEGEYKDNLKWYTRLTIYSDGFKIDFGFQSVKLAKYANDMPLYKIYLDKDNILPEPEVYDDRKFYIKKPTEEEFLDRMNTFFFDTSYIVKSLLREEFAFEKYIEAEIHENKIIKLLEWYIAIKNDFLVNTGIYGRYFKKYLSEDEWQMFLATFSDCDKHNVVKSLFAKFDLVRYLGKYIAKNLNYKYPAKHERDMYEYCLTKLKSYGYRI